jgi:hypothetical protein
MCEECITPQPRRKIRSPYCGCGCLAIRRFLTPEEKIEMLEDYRKQLQKEITGVGKAIEEIKREMK